MEFHNTIRLILLFVREIHTEIAKIVDGLTKISKLKKEKILSRNAIGLKNILSLKVNPIIKS